MSLLYYVRLARRRRRRKRQKSGRRPSADRLIYSGWTDDITRRPVPGGGRRIAYKTKRIMRYNIYILRPASPVFGFGGGGSEYGKVILPQMPPPPSRNLINPITTLVHPDNHSTGTRCACNSINCCSV